MPLQSSTWPYNYRMQFLESITIHEFRLEWLRSEWKEEWNEPGKPPDRNLIDNPDLNSTTENNKRASLLTIGLHRGQIIYNMPSIKDVQRIAIEPSDLQKLYLVSSTEWNTRTGGNYRLTDTTRTLKPGSDTDVKVTAILNKLGDKLAGEVIILVATNRLGPYSIIDGNHRAIALYRRYLQNPQMPPWRSLLIVDPEMQMSPWHQGPYATQFSSK